jgi:CheY-like chemotaxis protein/HPt (histidine-containing phosphotransfer) domain-containing protein
VRSTLGSGTIFEFELPFQKCADSQLAFVEKQDLATALLQSKGARKLRILVAEDNATIRVIMQSVLGDAGHHITLVDNGRSASHQLHAVEFDVAILDMQMPYQSGIEVIQEYKQKTLQHATPVFILLTANVSRQVLEEAKQSGFDFCLSKPIEISPLLQLLIEISNKSPASMVEKDREASPPQTVPLLDASILTDLASTQSDINFVDLVISAFEKDAKDLTKKLLLAISSAHPDLIKTHAHALTGCAKSIGAISLAELAKEFEALEGRDVDDIFPGLYEQLKSMLDMTLVELKNLENVWREEKATVK